MTEPSTNPDQVENVEQAFAAVDLGTQTALLLIAIDRGPNRPLEVVEDHAFAARLGEGLERGGALSPVAAERTLEILQTFGRRLELRGVRPERVRAVGTAVLRRASDGSAFAERVRDRIGLPLEVLSGDDEARLAHRAAIEVLPESDRGNAIVLDVGGGSSEAVFDGGGERRSLELGALSATDRFAPTELLAGVRAAVEAALPEGQAGAARGVWLGGAASNLACLERGIEAYDPRLAEGFEAETSSATRWAERLLSLDLEGRRDLPIEPDRADILPAGLALLGAISARLGLARAVVTGRGLRYALVRELAGSA